MNVVGRILVDIRLLQHHIRQLNELLGVELVSNALILRHIVEQREDFLSTRVRRELILLLELALH